MEIKTVKYITLTEQEIKEAIRKHLIDKLGTEIKINERNIELSASISTEETLYNFTATLTVMTDAL